VDPAPVAGIRFPRYAPAMKPSPVGMLLGALLAACTGAQPARPPAPEAGTLVPGRLPASWYAGGPVCSGTPSLSVHAYTSDFYILRQPACTNYEKPFLYLLLGRTRALLLDTGAGGLNVAGTVDSLLDVWRARQGGDRVQLIVAHSHSHGDHVAGDSQFVGRAGVSVVGLDTASVRGFFGIQQWPEEMVSLDLGGRVLDVLPIPGHQAASLAFYDRRTGVLLSGDTFYPGRLYVRDSAAYVRSIARLARFAGTHAIVHILGTHIENTDRPGQDYPVGTVDQPEEHVLQLTKQDLLTLDSALAGMRGRLVRTVLPQFTIWPLPPR
jgi:glyoxylase-like metal-dependent hydrolase (beta-lactamase superfamily II)